MHMRLPRIGSERPAHVDLDGGVDLRECIGRDWPGIGFDARVRETIFRPLTQVEARNRAMTSVAPMTFPSDGSSRRQMRDDFGRRAAHAPTYLLHLSGSR
jgi:hypothetical protein